MELRTIDDDTFCTNEFGSSENYAEQNDTRLQQIAEEVKEYTIHDQYVKQSIQTSFISKRSGDFLQVLSCMADMSNQKDFILNNTVKRAESIEILETAIRLRTHWTTELLPHLHKIKEARTIDDVKQCYTYALHYFKVVNSYSMIPPFMSTIQEFITTQNSIEYKEYLII